MRVNLCFGTMTLSDNASTYGVLGLGHERGEAGESLRLNTDTGEAEGIIHCVVHFSLFAPNLPK
jgi:hypothetical protein